MKRLIDGLYVDQLFQRTETGDTVYYPYGMIGPGYLLSAEREAEIRRATRLLMLVSLVSGGAFGLFALRVVNSPGSLTLVGGLVLGGVMAGLVGLVVYLQSRLVRGLERAPEPRPAARDWLKRARGARPTWALAAFIVLGVLCVILSAGGFLVGDALGVLSGIVLLLIGGLLLWDGVRGLIERSRLD
jgi:hypothetical protein